MKRERSSNFNEDEVRLLTELVAKHRTIIDNKKNDTVTNKRKEAAWNKIGVLYNAATSSIARSTKSLKLKYEGIRKETKKAMSKHTQEQYKVGDGPSSGSDNITDVEEKVMAICSNITPTSLYDHNDNGSLSDQGDLSLQVPQESINYETENDDFDAQMHVQVTINDEAEKTQKGVFNAISAIFSENDDFDAQKPVQVQNDDAEKTQKENNWPLWNQKALQSRINPGLYRVNQKVSEKGAKLDQLTNARLELVALQKEIATKEHQLVKYEHKLKIQNLRNDEKRKQEIHEILVRQLNNGVRNETNILDINTNKD